MNNFSFFKEKTLHFKIKKGKVKNIIPVTVLGFSDTKVDECVTNMITKRSEHGDIIEMWHIAEDTALECLEKYKDKPEEELKKIIVTVIKRTLDKYCDENKKMIPIEKLYPNDEQDEDNYKPNPFEKTQFKSWSYRANGTKPTNEYIAMEKALAEGKIFKNSPKQAEILQMIEEGHTQKEIANIMNCSEANISQQLKKVRHKIEKHYLLKTIDEIETEIARQVRNAIEFMKEVLETETNFNDEIRELIFDYFGYDDSIDILELVANRPSTDTDILDIIQARADRDTLVQFNSILHGVDISKSKEIYKKIYDIFIDYLIK